MFRKLCSSRPSLTAACTSFWMLMTERALRELQTPDSRLTECQTFIFYISVNERSSVNYYFYTNYYYYYYHMDLYAKAPACRGMWSVLCPSDCAHRQVDIQCVLKRMRCGRLSIFQEFKTSNKTSRDFQTFRLPGTFRLSDFQTLRLSDSQTFRVSLSDFQTFRLSFGLSDFQIVNTMNSLIPIIYVFIHYFFLFAVTNAKELGEHVSQRKFSHRLTSMRQTLSWP